MNAMFDKPGIISAGMTSQANAPGLPDPRILLSGDWSEALHEPFVRQAKRVGGFAKMAIIGYDQSISYAELDQLSNQLAHYLCAHDCCGKVVAIYATRSPTLVWAMLGVLKAGAAFLVLDSAYPAARLAEYCRQATPHALLQLSEAGALPSELLDTLRQAQGKAPADRLILPKTLAAASELLGSYSDSAPNIDVGPNDLAYVMFTSGSTGKPKGILGIHAPPAHFMAWHCRTFGFTESERFSMLSGLAHDIVLRDIFAPLSVGATLCIPHPDDFLPGRISAWMRENQITVAHLTPPTGHLISADEISFESLRYLFFGGDKLPTSLVERLHKLAPHVTCVNFYGATETPQAMGYFIVPRDLRHGLNRSVVPIGRGIGDVQLLVLSSEFELAAVEEVGEIAIRTPYLALGYLGDELASSEKFMLNPFTRQKGDRLYRTGDLGRYLPESCGAGSGNVEILGRKDRQVQIRGFRIELSEIEAALNAHPDVRQSVVLLAERAKGPYFAVRKRIVAYVAVRKRIVASQPMGNAWRAYLRQKLPDYMVPNNLVELEHFPLTPNGKIDYSALPEPTYLRETLVAPRTPIEEGLVQLWQDVLLVEQVGVHDNFFELGGHSLLAVQVISRIQAAF
ncbi:MAG: non-ribosomal peptide synthetase, partial [Ardenticatenaceae bacterium]